MHTWTVVLAAVALANPACKRPPAVSLAATDGGPQYEVRIGAGDALPPHVKFQIDTAYPGHRPSQRAPWHEPGGNWIFCDAHTDGGAAFGFGLELKATTDQFAFSRAMLNVADRQAGAKLLGEMRAGRMAPPRVWRSW